MGTAGAPHGGRHCRPSPHGPHAVRGGGTPRGDLDRHCNPPGRATLAAVAVWADELSRTPGAHGRWHYDDAPVCAAVLMARACRDAQCGSEQLEQLIDRGATHRERDEALKRVVHLGGDLRQPLHAADNDDRGGNRLPVAVEGVRTRCRGSLHRAWDNGLAKSALGTSSRHQEPRTSTSRAREAQALVAGAGQRGGPVGMGVQQPRPQRGRSLPGICLRQPVPAGRRARHRLRPPGFRSCAREAAAGRRPARECAQQDPRESLI
ncbi:MAG: hypothetical protein JSS29_08200 [Proteobacteria bacterium]|nr:hypothetical protein [Pseudomonadota bacterium]